MSEAPAAEWVSVASLAPWAKNPRVNDDAAQDIAKSIIRFGFGAPVIARAENREVIAGHSRLKAVALLRVWWGNEAEDAKKTWSADARKIATDLDPQVPVRFLDLSEAEAHALALADNKIDGAWDDEALLVALRDLAAGGADLDGLGWDEGVLDGLIGTGDDSLVPNLTPDPGPPPVTSGPAHSVLGEIYELGPHRLACGDCRDVGRTLLAGTRPSMVWTDPPYGMRLETNYKKVGHGGGRTYEPIAGDGEEYDPRAVMALVTDVKEQFWFGADYYRAHLPSGGGWFVWDKRANDAGMDLDALFGAAFELCWSRQSHKREVIRILWAMTHGRYGEDISGVHPTQKPTALARWFIDRWSDPGGIVVDFYGGSGTTVIAAAQADRVAYVSELSAHYCDVIRRRWTRWAKDAGVDPGPGALDPS